MPADRVLAGSGRGALARGVLSEEEKDGTAIDESNSSGVGGLFE